MDAKNNALKAFSICPHCCSQQPPDISYYAHVAHCPQKQIDELREYLFSIVMYPAEMHGDDVCSLVKYALATLEGE